MATATIVGQFTPATIAQGDPTVYRITLANDVDGIALTAAKATVLLGPDIQVATVRSNTCGGAVSVAPGLNGRLELSGGTVPAAIGATEGRCTIEIDVTSTVSGNHTVSIPANQSPAPMVSGFEAVQSGTTVYNSTLAQATLLVTGLSQPTGDKSFNPTTAVAGDDNTLTITLRNPNKGSTMPLTAFVDPLPAGMTIASTPNASVTCTGTGFANGTLTATPGSSEVRLTGGTIGQATDSTPGTCVISVRVHIPMGQSGNTLDNSVPADAIGNTRGLGSPAFNKTVLVKGPLEVGKGFADPVVPVGIPTTMTLTISNRGHSEMSNAGVVDALPANMVVATPGSTGGTCAMVYAGRVSAYSGGTSVAVSGITLPAGEQCTLTTRVLATTEGTHNNTATAQATVGGEVVHAASATVPLTAYGELRVVKSVQPTRVAPGQWVQYSVQVQNYTGVTVTALTLRDSLPKINVAGTDYPMGLTNSFIVSDSCGMTYTPSGVAQNAATAPELLGTSGTVPAGTGISPGICTVTFRAQVPGDVPSNTALTFNNSLDPGAVTGVGPNGGVQNTYNVAAANVAVVDSVGLTKSFLASGKSVAAGQTSRLRLTVFNRYVTALSDIRLTDPLPAGLTLATDPAAVNTCNGSVEAFPNGNQITLTGGSIAARGDTSVESTCYVEVSVTGTTPGSYLNTIPAGSLQWAGGSLPSAASDTLKITAGITGSKTFSPDSMATGGVARVRVRVTNQTPGTLTNVSVNDSGFGAGLTVANPANATTSCGGSPVILANPGASAVRMDGVVLTGGASCDLSFDVLARGAGPWVNSIPVGQITSAEGAVNSAEVKSTLAVRSAALALNKSFNPVIVTGNQPSLLTLDVVNSSSAPIQGASFTDVFPHGIVVYSVPDASTTCQGATVSAVPDSGQVSLTGANLPANSSCRVLVRVTSVAFLNLTNTIPAGAVSSQGGHTNAQPTSATLSTLQGLGVSKGFEPAYVEPGQVARLKIRLANTFDPNIVNPTILTGVTYTDALPAGLVVAPSPNASTTCSGGTVHAAAGDGAITLTGATLVPGSLCDVWVNVLPSGAAGASYRNQIPAGNVITDQGVSNLETGEATLTVVEVPTVGKVFNPTNVRVGTTSQLTVTVTNPASVPLTGVSLTDNLPPGLAVANTPGVSFPGSRCGAGAVVTAAAGATKVVMTGATVAAGGICQFQVNVVASEAKTYTNTLGAGAIQSDQRLTNANPAHSDLVVVAPPSVTKTFEPVQIGAGGTSTLTLTVTNPNTAPVTMSQALVDALPGKVFVADPPNLGGTCTGTKSAVAGGVSVSYGGDGASIPPGSCTVTVDVTSSVPGAYTNLIAAGQLKTSAGDNAEPAVATLGVDQPAAPSVNKSFNPNAIDQGGTSLLTITLGNPNATELTLTGPLTDTLPANVLVAPGATVGGTCAAAGVTATPGGSTVVYATGAKIPAAGCTISVAVTSGVAGAYTNTIPAGGLTTDGGANPLPTQAGLVVRSAAEPTVLKAFSPTTINPGDVSRLTITLGNANAMEATLTADLVDTLPANVLVAPTPAVGGTCVGTKEASAGDSTVIFKAGGIVPAKGACTIEVNVTSSVAGGPYVNTIAAGDLKTDLGTNGAPGTANLLVNPGQPPSVSKSFSPTSIVAGQQSTLTISLGNSNAGALTLTADMTDTLTNMTAMVPAVTTGTSCDTDFLNVTAGAVTFRTGGAIPPGGCVIAVRVTSSAVVASPGHPNTIAKGALKTDGGDNAVGTTANLVVTSDAPEVIASIAGTVYHDRNDNGAIDAGEEGIADVEIRLMQGGVVVATTTTDADGRYSFTNLVPGTYTVMEVHPAGWSDGRDTAGSHGGAAGNDIISNVTVAGGDNATDYNFGERRPAGSVAAIPVNSPFGLVLLALMVVMFGLHWLRRHLPTR